MARIYALIGNQRQFELFLETNAFFGGSYIFDIFCPVARLITNLRGKGGVGQLLHLSQPAFDQILALDLPKSPDQSNKRGSFHRYRQLVSFGWDFPHPNEIILK